MNLKEFLNLTFYTSEIDQFLLNFEKEHPQLSKSQAKEVRKHKKIFEMRDKAIEPLPSNHQNLEEFLGS